jgi:hypothetical protein
LERLIFENYAAYFSNRGQESVLNAENQNKEWSNKLIGEGKVKNENCFTAFEAINRLVGSQA